MLKPARQYFRLSNDAFAEEPMPIGTVVSAKSSDRFIIVNKCRNSEPYGILLSDVVNMDLTKYHLDFTQCKVGSKVLVLSHGIIYTSNIDKSFTEKTQILTNVYVDSRNGKFTTRKHKFSSRVVGKTQSLLDDDGYIKIEVNF